MLSTGESKAILVLLHLPMVSYIHQKIRPNSDLKTNTDPIFYLHHAQLDRLWWIWQQDKLERAHEYGGVDKRLHEASLEDELDRKSVV